MKCPLCRLVRKNELITPLVYQDNTITITFCTDCNNSELDNSPFMVPLVVLNRHKAKPNEKELRHIHKMMNNFFPDKVDRGYMRKIKDHYSAHWIENGGENV